MRRILLVQGANLTYLGKREPEIYGTTTAEELNQTLLGHSPEKGYQLDIFYSNIEGEAINRIYEAADAGTDGLVMNPAGFTYARYPSRIASRAPACRTWKSTSVTLRSEIFTACCPIARSA